ncbi:hypothetical protein HZC20_03680 [Candidatus Peregrinibacteria bacterium]|nr:hypothetical protein [Candidatus Peregrinibacteria bacterium]
MEAQLINHIARVSEEGDPHIGAETEGITTDRHYLDVVHAIRGQQPTHAIKEWIRANCQGGEKIARDITCDIPETTVEANPAPLRSPLSSAASQRLMAIIIDHALRALSGEDGVQLLNGAAWRPPDATAEDVSRHIPLWKQAYYKHQIGVHGDKTAAAAGDHLNLSAPWLGRRNDKKEISRRMIELTAQMRLIAAALSISISASSPLYFSSNGSARFSKPGTSLTQWDSARLGQVWPGRTIMDVADLYASPISFRRTLNRYRENGVLKTGRDIWLPVRAQPGSIEKYESFEEICSGEGLNMSTEGGKADAEKKLMASYKYGPSNPRDNQYSGDKIWQNIEGWRQRMLQAIIETPRNRVEVRTLETPPAFEDQTPYEYIKAVHTFLEMLFIYLSTNPDFLDNLEYDGITLQAAKHNEEKVLTRGLDAEIYWIPNMTTTTPRDLLRFVLGKIEDLSRGMGRQEDLRIIQELVSGGLKTPAVRIREEVGEWYGVNIEDRSGARILAGDEYPRELLDRTREAMPKEVEQIRTDLPRMPEKDRPYIESLLAVVDEISKSKIVTTSTYATGG